MRPSLVKESLTHLINVKQPVMIWGPPGVGKSETVKQVADELGYGLIDLRLALYESVDLRGIPEVMERGVGKAKIRQTEWVTPSMFPRNGKWIIFMDELPQAKPSVQAAASQLILDRKIGDYILPDTCVIIAAGNRDTDRAATNKMPSHIANRFTHIDYEISTDDWVEWALTHNIDPMLVAFIRFRPELLHKFDVTQKAFPSPRSWSFVNRLFSKTLSKEALYELVAGTVGSGAANDFIGFLRIYHELPEYDDIVSRPMKVHVPENSGVLYAISALLASSTRLKDSKPVFTYINRLPKEFQLYSVMDMGRKNIDLCETRDYIKWKAENQDLILNS